MLLFLILSVNVGAVSLGDLDSYLQFSYNFSECGANEVNDTFDGEHNISLTNMEVGDCGSHATLGDYLEADGVNEYGAVSNYDMTKAFSNQNHYNWTCIMWVNVTDDAGQLMNFFAVASEQGAKDPYVQFLRWDDRSTFYWRHGLRSGATTGHSYIPNVNSTVHSGLRRIAFVWANGRNEAVVIENNTIMASSTSYDIQNEDLWGTDDFYLFASNTRGSASNFAIGRIYQFACWNITIECNSTNNKGSTCNSTSALTEEWDYYVDNGEIWQYPYEQPSAAYINYTKVTNMSSNASIRRLSNLSWTEGAGSSITSEVRTSNLSAFEGDLLYYIGFDSLKNMSNRTYNPVDQTFSTGDDDHRVKEENCKRGRSCIAGKTGTNQDPDYVFSVNTIFTNKCTKGFSVHLWWKTNSNFPGTDEPIFKFREFGYAFGNTGDVTLKIWNVTDNSETTLQHDLTDYGTDWNLYSYNYNKTHLEFWLNGVWKASTVYDCNDLQDNNNDINIYSSNNFGGTDWAYLDDIYIIDRAATGQEMLDLTSGKIGNWTDWTVQNSTNPQEYPTNEINGSFAQVRFNVTSGSLTGETLKFKDLVGTGPTPCTDDAQCANNCERCSAGSCVAVDRDNVTWGENINITVACEYDWLTFSPNVNATCKNAVQINLSRVNTSLNGKNARLIQEANCHLVPLNPFIPVAATVKLFAYSSMWQATNPLVNHWPNDYIYDEIPANLYTGYAMAAGWARNRTKWANNRPQLNIEWTGAIQTWGSEAKKNYMIDMRNKTIASLMANYSMVRADSLITGTNWTRLMLGDDVPTTEWNSSTATYVNYHFSSYENETGVEHNFTNKSKLVHYYLWFENATRTAINNFGWYWKQNRSTKIGFGYEGGTPHVNIKQMFGADNDAQALSQKFWMPCWVNMSRYDFVAPYKYSRHDYSDIQNNNELKIFLAKVRTCFDTDEIIVSLQASAPQTRATEIPAIFDCNSSADCNTYAYDNQLTNCLQSQNQLWYKNADAYEKCVCSSDLCYQAGDTAETGTNNSVMRQDAEVLYQQGMKWMGWYRNGFWLSDYAGDVARNYSTKVRLTNISRPVLLVMNYMWQFKRHPVDPDYTDKTDESNPGTFYEGYITNCSNFDVISDLDILAGHVNSNWIKNRNYTVIWMKHNETTNEYSHIPTIKGSNVSCIYNGNFTMPDSDGDCIPDCIDI